MTDCCNTYGTCTQGRDCPARADKASTVPPEAGNFQIIDLGPDDIDAAGQPMGHDEIMAGVRLLLKLAVVVATIVVVLGVATGYATERWADVLWAYLAGVS